jgi:hypothetical protein
MNIEKLTVLRDLLLHRHLVADDEPIAHVNPRNEPVVWFSSPLSGSPLGPEKV